MMITILGKNSPLYGAALGFDFVRINNSTLQFHLSSSINSYTNIVWHILRARFQREYGCDIDINTHTSQVLRSACLMSRL